MDKTILDWISIEGHKPDSSDKNWPMFFAIGSMVRYATDLPLLLTVMSQSDEAKIIFNKKVRILLCFYRFLIKNFNKLLIYKN